ncbi:hypothetical protein KC355_g18038 [Hortaea werneckii]|nr:hypothetical protein KC355_g18038 [Hortaea werneckii]
MERSTSHQVLTRGTARANPLAALSDLAAAAATHSQGGPSSTLTRENPFAPVIPSYHAVSRSDKSFAGAPTPSGVGLVEGENDFEMMRRSGHHHHGLSNGYHAAGDPEGLPDAPSADAAAAEDAAAAAALGGAEMRRQLLDQALGLPSITQPYRLPLIESGPAVIGKGVDRPNWTGFSDVRVYEQQRMRQQISNFGAGGGKESGGAGGSGVGGNSGGAGGGGTGSLAAALQGRIAGGAGGGGEAMSRTTSTGGGSEMGEPSATATTTSTRRGGRGRLV